MIFNMQLWKLGLQGVSHIGRKTCFPVPVAGRKPASVTMITSWLVVPKDGNEGVINLEGNGWTNISIYSINCYAVVVDLSNS